MNFVDRHILPAMRPGDRMTNEEIYFYVRVRAKKNKIKLSKHWKATVRNTLQRHCLRHPKCGDRPLFLRIDRATWRLR